MLSTPRGDGGISDFGHDLEGARPWFLREPHQSAPLLGQALERLP